MKETITKKKIAVVIRFLIPVKNKLRGTLKSRKEKPESTERELL